MSLISALSLSWLRRSFRAQLTTLTVVVVVFANLMLVGGMSVAFVWDAERSQRAQVESAAQMASTALVGPMLEANYAEAADIARDAVALGAIGYIRVSQPDGRVLVEAGKLRSDRWLLDAHEQPIEFGAQVLGRLSLQMARAPWEGALIGWLVALAISVVLSLGFAYVLFHRFIRRVESRIGALKRATEAFVAGNTEARAGIAGEDELAEFGRAFDAAMQNIAGNQTTLRETAHAAQAASIAKSRFLATMSHEIRTPLNGVLGMAQLMLMGPTTVQEQQNYARTILNSGNTLLALLNDVLDLSKIEAGRFALEKVNFSAVQLLQESAHLMEASAAEKGLALHVEWLGETGGIQGDAHRLRQMLTNLIGNAVKFTDAGSIRIEGRVLPDAQPDGQLKLRFTVSDTGIGIPADKLHQLFKPFSQVDDSDTRRFGGSGLGLSIVRSLAEQMGGGVGVDSVPGEGSRFWFEILAQKAVGPDLRANDRHPVHVDVTPKSSGCVLVVEDNLTNRLVVEKLLQKAGYEVLTAENGLLGLEAFRTHASRIDLVLMDVQMPVMDGLQAAREIRNHEAIHGLARMPVVGLTANAYAEDRTACLAAGMDEFLTKPVQVAQLLHMVRRFVVRVGGPEPASP